MVNRTRDTAKTPQRGADGQDALLAVDDRATEPVTDEARAAEDAYRATVGTRSLEALRDEAAARGTWLGVYLYDCKITERDAKARGEG
jgi:hypothetical protein